MTPETQDQPANVATPETEGGSAATIGYAHPTDLASFEKIHRQEYALELESCDRWIAWCKEQNPPDYYGVNFHQGMRSAHVFNNIKMEQLLRVLKQEAPNAASGHNAGVQRCAPSAFADTTGSRR